MVYPDELKERVHPLLCWLATPGESQLRLMPGIDDPGAFLLDDLQAVQAILCESSPLGSLLDPDLCADLTELRRFIESDEGEIFGKDAVMAHTNWARARTVASAILSELNLPYIEPLPVKTI
jgi:hypothetical protein